LSPKFSHRLSLRTPRFYHGSERGKEFGVDFFESFPGSVVPPHSNRVVPVYLVAVSVYETNPVRRSDVSRVVPGRISLESRLDELFLGSRQPDRSEVVTSDHLLKPRRVRQKPTFDDEGFGSKRRMTLGNVEELKIRVDPVLVHVE